ncbi:endo alpha-1,4 polygalactosaminidase [bacterium]|nr:endo alpha-1,4 polygalactosaminidase [bacterium]
MVGAGLLGCSSQPPAPSRWQQVDRFVCQLQNLDPARVPNTDLLITDPTQDGRTPLSASEMARLKSKSPLLLGYLSLGEAENYRPYWQKGWRPGRPAWLGPSNPEWGGNYKVHYWDPAWHRLVNQNADEIIAQGFDGLFLDVVDAWEFWEARRPQAKKEMIHLVGLLAEHTRRQKPDFGIFLNGGDGLLQDQRLLECITGVVKEEMFFGLGGDGQASPPEFTRDCQARLKPAVQAGKLVLSIDYTNDPGQKRQARENARKAGYLEFIGARNLDRIPADP